MIRATIYFLGCLLMAGVPVYLIENRFARWVDDNLSYLGYVLRHKYFVFKAGRILRVPLWQLIIHDWTKFFPFEWSAYRKHFYGGETESIETALCWSRAWIHHVNRNPHHWQYWCTDSECYEMPEVYVREMVADWMGAGRAINGKYETLAWYAGRKDKIRLNPKTREFVVFLMQTHAVLWEGKR